MASRIEKTVKEDGILLRIKPYVDPAKQKMLTAWLVAWTICGLLIISQLFTPIAKDTKLLIMVFLAFWIYFEYFVIKVFRWRRSGEEQFFITDEEIQFGRMYSNRGFLKSYRKELINKVRIIDDEVNNFTKVFMNSYWVIGGERLAFTIGGKVVPFGLKLSDKDAAKLKSIINKEID